MHIIIAPCQSVLRSSKECQRSDFAEESRAGFPESTALESEILLAIHSGSSFIVDSHIVNSSWIIALVE